MILWTHFLNLPSYMYVVIHFVSPLNNISIPFFHANIFSHYLLNLMTLIQHFRIWIMAIDFSFVQ